MELSAARNGAELLVQSLEAQGVEYIFGVPGGAVLPILDVLADHGPTFIVCRHETGAAFMAQAWGRVTGKPGVVLTTSGPGLINAVCGVSTATEDRDPLVIITGQVPRGMRFKQSHMNVDTVNLFAPITKWSVEAEEPDSIPEIVANAFRIAARPRPGAVHISMPVDVSKSAVTAKPIPAVESPSPGAAAAEALERAAALLSTATFPVILLGVGASRSSAAAAVRRLIRKHPLPVIGTFEAAGVVPRELVDRFVGRVGYVRNQPGDLVLQKADVILTIGYDTVEYDPTAWNVSGRAQIIHLDEIPCTVDRAYRPSVELPGNIARNLDGLSERLRLSAAGEWAEVAAARKVLLDEQAKGATLSGTPIHPLRFIHDLRQTIGDDVTVTCDTGAHEIWMARYFFSYEPRRVLFSMGHQTMGVALPWAIGTALARPGQKVVSVSGDGSFLMTCMELETAVRLKLPIVHVIWKDGGYNLIQTLQRRDYGRIFGATFGDPDFVTLGEAFGAASFRIGAADQIAPMLKKALACEGPALIEMPIDYRDNAQLVQTMDASAMH
ncbi:MAG: acetolactate synthase AlsS [Nitrospirae bacterium]|nr:MAG: acetolactate synthase AlsS [Nitrospirota bacterium]